MALPPCSLPATISAAATTTQARTLSLSDQPALPVLSVARETSDIYIISPNVSFVPPSPRVTQDIQMRSDGKYGDADYTARPQFYLSEYPHLPFIPTQRHLDYAGYQIMWRGLTPADLEPILPHSNPSLRQLSPPTRDTLTTCLTSVLTDLDEYLAAIRPLIPQPILRHAFYLINHLRARLYFATQKMPWRDLCRIWGQYQRVWLEIAGMQEFLKMQFGRDLEHPGRPVESFIGAFTDEEDVARKLFASGVPVWRLSPRDMIDSDVPCIPQHIYPPLPPLHPMSLGLGTENTPWEALGSFSRTDSSSVARRHQQDIEFMPNSQVLHVQTLLTSSRSELGSVEQKRHLSHKADRGEPSQRAAHRHHPYGPNPTHVLRVQPIPCPVADQLPKRFQRPVVLPEWATALLEYKDVPTARQARRYLLPIGTFFSEDDPIKRERQIINWLSVRENWFHHLRQQGLDTDPVLDREDWRQFLSHTPERGSFGRKRTNLTIFDDFLPGGAFKISPDTSTLPFRWFDRPYDRGDEEALIVTQRLIMWELDEIAFRQELLTLQRNISQRAGHSENEVEARRNMVYHIWDTYETEHGIYFKSPPAEDRGIGSFIWNFSVPAVNAARAVMESWPEAPQVIQSPLLTPVEANTIPVVQALRMELARFFCRTYLKHFGRFPIVPTQFPIPYST
ncbi:hypothetical protein SISNIDRAFT_541114 [Sistotremastrum niveocremeum HHB9708]|uniref:Uncharacterized protein n=1 Tax=Sistotremastrum niveocremeum HHB9708 TaxID=1314777 RepID=A0A164MLT2_9AGAM|nr:hypothetical protein SISNIDRAFT_541114 [Sistotremastrum niveocremeum HHB9708]